MSPKGLGLGCGRGERDWGWTLPSGKKGRRQARFPSKGAEGRSEASSRKLGEERLRGSVGLVTDQLADPRRVHCEHDPARSTWRSACGFFLRRFRLEPDFCKDSPTGRGDAGSRRQRAGRHPSERHGPLCACRGAATRDNSKLREHQLQAQFPRALLGLSFGGVAGPRRSPHRPQPPPPRSSTLG